MAEINGKPVTASDMETLALTNFGHFTSMRVDGGAVRGLSLHMERLERDCQEVFGAALDRERVLDYARQAAGGRLDSFTIRVTVFDPTLRLGNIGDAAAPSVLVTIRNEGQPSPPLTAKTIPFSRDSAQVKHVGLFGADAPRRGEPC